jgi:hypothetical protein
VLDDFGPFILDVLGPGDWDWDKLSAVEADETPGDVTARDCLVSFGIRCGKWLTIV